MIMLDRLDVGFVCNVTLHKYLVNRYVPARMKNDSKRDEQLLIVEKDVLKKWSTIVCKSCLPLLHFNCSAYVPNLELSVSSCFYYWNKNWTDWNGMLTEPKTTHAIALSMV